MRLEDMKNYIPETPEFIHDMLVQEVDKQMHGGNVVDIKEHKKKHYSMSRVAVAVAICVISISTLSYAGSKMYRMFFEKQGSYGTSTGISANDEKLGQELPEELYEIEFSSTYLPENTVWEGPKIRYEDGGKGCFSFVDALIGSNDLDRVIQDKNVIFSEKMSFGAYEGVYLKYDSLSNGNYDQRIYMLCPEKYRLIIAYVGSDMSKEEAVKVMESLVITETDRLLKTKDMFTLNDFAAYDNADYALEVPAMPAYNKPDSQLVPETLTIHKIKDKFEISASCEDNEGNYIDKPISVCVDDVQVADDLELLNEEYMPQEWADAVGADGKLMDNTISYIKKGDGINTLDEVVGTKTVKQRLVYVTVTYTNNSDIDLEDILFLGQMVLINDDGTQKCIYTSQDTTEGDCDRVIYDSVAGTEAMYYYDVKTEHGNGGNNIDALKQGESVQVNMAWIVDEDDLDNMHMAFNGDASAYTITPSMLESGIVDIRK